MRFQNPSEEAESQPLLASKLQGRTPRSRNDRTVNNYGIGMSNYSDNNLYGGNDRRSRYCVRIRMIFFVVVFGASVVSFNSFVKNAKSKISRTSNGGSKLKAISIDKWNESSHISDAMLTEKSVPFPVVDRCDYSEDSSDIVNPNLFHPLLRYNSSLMGSDIESGTSSDTSESHSRGPFLKVPFPTGAFWTNLVVQPTADRGLSYPIMVYPYGYKWSLTNMQVSYPPLRRIKDATSIRDIFAPDVTFSIKEKVSKRNVIEFDSLSVSLRFYSESNEIKNETSFTSAYDDDDNVPYWESYLVQGSPYITVKYVGVSPKLNALSTFKKFICPWDEKENSRDAVVDEVTEQAGQSKGHKLCTEMETQDDRSTILNGVQFLIVTQENLAWMMFASEPITMIFDQRTRTTITSTHEYKGILRMALVPPPLDIDAYNSKSANYASVSLATSTAVRRLIKHSAVYPIKSKVSWGFTNVVRRGHAQTFKTLLGKGNESETIGTITFTFETRSMNSHSHITNDGQELLMLALPHHREMLPSRMLLTGDAFDITYHCIKGGMSPIVGNIWSYDESLTNVEFDSINTLQMVSTMDNGVKDTIINQVKQDINQVLPSLEEDVYGFGKQIARLAQLTHIIFVLQHKSQSWNGTSSFGDAQDSIGTLLDETGKVLRKYLANYLDGKNSDKLVYDRNFGGIISLHGLQNKQADFGNGWYNDHHFHYGYLLYASAIMARIDHSFVSDYGAHIDAIFSDVLHSTEHQSDMQFFPMARHKSWFDGHSFASGLFAFSDGKSQESSSEAVNCYYGAYLWSLIRKGSNWGKETNFVKLLLAMEIRGAKTYWHMEPPFTSTNITTNKSQQIYDSKFESAYMVGNLGMMDVTVSTWFGTQILYVHMINLMPITEITRELFDKSYAKKEYEKAIRPIEDNVEMAWRGYTICDRAIFEPSKAWNEATKLKSHLLDSGTSLSQIYFWISTTTGFTSPSIPASNSNTNESKSDTSYPQSRTSSDHLCTENDSCSKLGLTGLCCPTEKGIFLECCNTPTFSKPPSPTKNPTFSKPQSPTKNPTFSKPQRPTNNLCTAHQYCTGLIGLCCPTEKGIFLECCY